MTTDNTTINKSTVAGGDTIYTEDTGPVKIPGSKIITGAHGVNGGPVTSSNPFPVSLVQSLIDISIDILQGVASGVESDSMLLYPGRRPDSYNLTPVNLTAATSAQTVKAGTTSKSIYVTDITISVDTAMWVSLEDNTGTPVQLIAKKFLPANSVWSKHFYTPKVVPLGKALNIKCSVGAGNVSVDLDGYVI